MEPREFGTEVLLSITTGRLLCDFSAMHECIEYLCGCPVFTHQLADAELIKRLKHGVLAQLPELDNEQISVIAIGTLILLMKGDTIRKGEGRKEDLNNLIVGWLSKYVWPIVGRRLSVSPLLISSETLGRSFSEPLEGKNVIVVNAGAGK